MVLLICSFCAPCLVGMALWNTTVQLFPDVPSHINAISPLLPAEFAHSKADLDRLFGAPGSDIRRSILERDASHPWDVLAIWGVFSGAVGAAMVWTRPKLWTLGMILIATSCGFLVLRSHILDLTIAAANTDVFTDQIAQHLYRLAQFQWSLMFVNTLGGSLLFLGSAPEVKSAAWLSILAAVLGIVGTAFYNPLIPYAALGVFFAVSGLALFCGFRPEMV